MCAICLQIESQDFALSVVSVRNRGLVETFVLGDVQGCHTYDLRLARFHLLRRAWTPDSLTALTEDRDVPLTTNGHTHPDDSPAPRSSTSRGVYGLNGMGLRASATSGVPASYTHALEGSRVGENQESVRIAASTAWCGRRLN
jgi:hypothetical protein